MAIGLILMFRITDGENGDCLEMLVLLASPLIIPLIVMCLAFLGPALVGNYSIEPAESEMIIRHRIFPFKSEEILRCKSAEELEFDLSLNTIGRQYFVVTDMENKKSVYAAQPNWNRLEPLVCGADSLIFEGNNVIKAIKNDIISTINIVGNMEDNSNSSEEISPVLLGPS